MATAAAAKPERGFAWVLRESTRPSLAIAALGAIALFIVALAVFVYLPLNGLKPVESLVDGFRSATFQGMLLTGSIIGILATVAGFASYRRMPTKVSREAAVAGAVLGLQGLVIGFALYFVARGNRVDVFALNYFNFERMEGNYDLFVRGFLNTINLAGTSEFFGIILGLALAVFAISKRSVVRAPARVYINLFRGTPLVWQIAFIGIALPIALGQQIDTYNAAKIALSLNAGAYIAEVFRAGIQSIERGQMEAARSLGMTYPQAMRYAIVPQAVRRVIPPLLNEFVVLIKDTSLIVVLGLVESQYELFTTARTGYSEFANATFFVAAAIGYLAVTLPLIRAVNIVEHRLRSGLTGIVG